MEKPTIALIAHDAKKADMVYLVQAHREEFSQLNLVATGTTGKFIQARIGLPVRLMKSGPQGGDQQIGASQHPTGNQPGDRRGGGGLHVPSPRRFPRKTRDPSVGN